MLRVKGHMGQGNAGQIQRFAHHWVKVKGHIGYAQPKGHDIGRWAHVNVKLHFLTLDLMPCTDEFDLNFFSVPAASDSLEYDNIQQFRRRTRQT